MNKFLLEGLVIFHFVILSVFHSIAQDQLDTIKCKGIKCFDIDSVPGLSEDELITFIIHIKKIPINKTTDSNFDRNIDRKHYQLYLNQVKEAFGDPPYKLEDFYKIEKLFPELNEQIDIPIIKSFLQLPILLRESSEDVTPYNSAKGLSDAQPAIFSYGRNFLENSNVWVAKGAIMYRLINKNRYFVFPGISFNRVITPDSSEQANSLVFRLGAHFISGKENNILELSAFRYYINYATDFSLKSKQAGLEIEWEPLFRYGPFGNYFNLDRNGNFRFRVETYLRSETGYIFDAGDKKGLIEHELFLRFGGKVGVDIQFFKCLQVSASKMYLKAFIGDPKETQLLNSSASYLIGEDEQIGIKIEYQKGNLPLTLEKVENMLLGLAIKL